MPFQKRKCSTASQWWMRVLTIRPVCMFHTLHTNIRLIQPSINCVLWFIFLCIAKCWDEKPKLKSIKHQFIKNATYELLILVFFHGFHQNCWGMKFQILMHHLECDWGVPIKMTFIKFIFGNHAKNRKTWTKVERNKTSVMELAVITS